MIIAADPDRETLQTFAFMWVHRAVKTGMMDRPASGFFLVDWPMIANFSRSH
jgi:hypothetical protein